MQFNTGYMDEALFDLGRVLDLACEVLADVKFDTLVGTGFSGGVVVPALALRMGRNFVLIRKDTDDSHHGGDLMGTLEGRWLFVDDFVSSGRTRDRVLAKIREYDFGGMYTYVGSYLYSTMLAPGLQLVSETS